MKKECEECVLPLPTVNAKVWTAIKFHKQMEIKKRIMEEALIKFTNVYDKLTPAERVGLGVEVGYLE